MKMLRCVVPVLLTGVMAVAFAAPVAPPAPAPQMKAVLDQLASLGPKPIEKLSPQEARRQPTPADAVMALIKKQGKSAPEQVGTVKDMSVPGPGGPIPVRVYTPEGTGPFPVVVYIHGGGWVIATIDTYDASARAITNLAQAVVVSVEYRKAPEHRFPAAHEDCYAVTQYVMKNAAGLNGDPARVAIMGESAGGNMATAVCMMARERHGRMPIHQVLVYPVADTRTDTPSYKENATAKPLDKAMMQWFFKHTISRPSDKNSPYLAVLRGNVEGLPPATVITAEIDPLRSEGKAYAEKMKKAGISVRYRNYEGVTHEFFGMGAVVDEAHDAEAFAANGLKSAFSQ